MCLLGGTSVFCNNGGPVMQQERVALRVGQFGLLSFISPNLLAAIRIVAGVAAILVILGVIVALLSGAQLGPLFLSAVENLPWQVSVTLAGVIIALVIAHIAISSLQQNRYIRGRLRELEASGMVVSETLILPSSTRLIWDDSHGEVALLELNVSEKSYSCTRFPISEVAAVRYRIEPQRLAANFEGENRYALGGLLVGGVTGVLVGSLIDSFRQAKLKKSFDFRLEIDLELDCGERFELTPVDQSFGYDMTEAQFTQRAESTLQEMREYIATLKRRFGPLMSQGGSRLRKARSGHVCVAQYCQKCGSDHCACKECMPAELVDDEAR